ncbi:MAG: 3-deoxy-D-manno-octulosonic acid transferase [Vitreoscilla sp.]|nr:3-deoxy-D-manno-octulosonic acid transferase [Polaromonas sp.]
MLGLYSGLMRLAQPLLRRKMAKRALQEPGYGESVGERFGRYTQPVEATSQLVWLHAVSLGETRTAAVLINALRAQHPGLRILLSHGTATGRAEGKVLLQPGDVQVWQPWDTRVVVERFFEHFKPRLGLLMETEIWPCTVASAKSHGIPLVLVNGRLSEKSLQQALTMSPLAYPAYGALTAVYAQTVLDAKRYRQLGVEVAGVFGNLKFDAAPSPSQQVVGKAWRKALDQSVVMFASSREGEEGLFLEEIKAVAQQIQARAAPDSIAVKYLIVPRHPQRFDEVAALVVQHGLTLSRRTSWSGGPLENDAAMQADIWLGDTLGEMPLYYSLSDVALIGGSFEKLGGQNLIEAAACSCPVVMGPHTFNFQEAAELAEEAGAAFRAADMASSLLRVKELLASPSAMLAAQSAAGSFALQHRGATEKTCQALAHLLSVG